MQQHGSGLDRGRHDPHHREAGMVGPFQDIAARPANVVRCQVGQELQRANVALLVADESLAAVGRQVDAQNARDSQNQPENPVPRYGGHQPAAYCFHFYSPIGCCGEIRFPLPTPLETNKINIILRRYRMSSATVCFSQLVNGFRQGPGETFLG